MIYISGDLHGGLSAYYVTSARFRPAKRGDIVICTGDFGGVWWNDSHTCERHCRDEDRFLGTTLRKRVTWLATDGNHENFARLFGGEFPVVSIYGGKAYQVRENIYYLKRGEVFEIDGHTFFVFGGANSHDRFPIKVPSLAWDSSNDYTSGRTEGIDWWPEEIPSQEDLENAYINLDRFGWRVDYVITHTCPKNIRLQFLKTPRRPDPTEEMLQGICDKLQFGEWHFGHFHVEKQVGKFHCHYGRVWPLKQPL